MAGIRVTARLAVRIDLYRPVNRDAVPGRDDDAWLERCMREAGQHLRYEVASRVALKELLEQERQEGRPRLVRDREDVVGVQIAQVREDIDHLIVELTLRESREAE